MPAEAQRLRRRLQTRDRLILGLAAIAAASTPAALFLTAHQHQPPSGCKTEIVAGFMGGETHTICDTAP